ncbi:MAG: GSCFA domain-containing protein [Chitinophagaceae bacterium]|nr:GSCFA domain-containing protein [Chitinophagaceae bacterium]
MDYFINIDLKKHPHPIQYRDRILLTGSCFTEHIGNALAALKFDVLQNPNGILFGPDAVCKSLLSYKDRKLYTEKDLFPLNEVWYSWDHHSRYAHINREEALKLINDSQIQAHDYLKSANWLVITLGSSFSYALTEEAALADTALNSKVANCHRAPASWFRKELLETTAIIEMLNHCIVEIRHLNPDLQIIFTISPVRHIRDGVVENNRSKARLIEAVHQIVSSVENSYYFPAYELVIDVLRDYRFYDIDLVHPNYAATSFVLEKFTDTCIAEESRVLMKEIRQIINARKHRPLQPGTQAHRQFLVQSLEKVNQLQQQYPFLNWTEEIRYFSNYA